MGEGEKMPCILCGNDTFHVYFADHGIKASPAEKTAGSAGPSGTTRFNVFRCTQCGLSFSHQSHSDCVNPPSSGIKSRVSGDPYLSPPEIIAAPELGQDEIKEISQFVNPPGTLLNVGNDCTDILETAKLFGWTPSSVAAPDVETSKQEFPAAERESESVKYDVIRLENSLERAECPKEYLKKVNCLLRKNGLLVITTPDCSGWDFPIFGQGLSLLPLDLPNWFFTPESLRELLKQSGFKILKVSAYDTRYSFPLDSAIPDLPNGSFQPSNTGEMPLTSLKGMRHLRIFARHDRKGIFSSIWMEKRESQPAEHLVNLETEQKMVED